MTTMKRTEKITQDSFGANVGVDFAMCSAVEQLLTNVFGDIAILAPDIVYENIVMACDGGFDPSDRLISKEVVDWLMDNFGFLFLGLISSDTFRASVHKAVSYEFVIEDFANEGDADCVRKIREMQDTSKMQIGEEKCLIDLGRYNDDVFRFINRRLLEGFQKVEHLKDKINQQIAGLSEEDKLEIGYCVSNFMFLLRAFAKNGGFLASMEEACLTA